MELRDEIVSVIIGKVSKLFSLDPGSISDDTQFVEDLKAQSVNYVQIIGVLEEEFGVDINFMEFRRKKTIGEAGSYVASLL